jgi:hypothetical protein
MDPNACMQMLTPDYWPARLGQIEDSLRRLRRGRVETFGLSAGNRPLWAVVYEAPGATQTLCIVGGTHGHEPGTCVSCVNAMHVLEHGRDLKGDRLPALSEAAERINLLFIPVLNADGRARLPGGFHATWSDNTIPYERGINAGHRLNQGETGELLDGIDPSAMVLLGGRYNDAGFLMNRPTSVTETRNVEVRQMLDWLDRYPPDCLVDLHACGSNFFIMNRMLPEPYREKMRAINGRVTDILQARGSQIGPIDGDQEPSESGFVSNVRMVYHRFGSLAFVFEGRQGYLNFPPLFGYDRIVDDYLTVIAETAAYGAEEGFRP